MRFPGSPILGPEVWGLIARIAGSVAGADPSTKDELISESSVGWEGRFGNEGEPSRPIGEMGPGAGNAFGCRSRGLFPFVPTARMPKLLTLPLLRVR
jgi:hypothetical protein